MEASDDDIKAMREALSAALEQVNKVYDILSRPCVFIEEARQGCREARGVLIPALAAPPRNCDVGTAEEQTARYRKFCSAHKYLGSDFSHMCKGFGKGRCPFFNNRTKSQCEFAWSQMPYEEGETDGSR